jgi:hypothetical protein
MLCCVKWQTVNDASEDHRTFNFRVKQSFKTSYMGIYGCIMQVQTTRVVKRGLGWKAKVGGGNMYLARPWYTGRTA